MSSPKDKAAAPEADKAAEKPQEEILNERIIELRGEIEKIEAEIHILQGRLKNRNPALAKAVKRENDELGARLKKLQTALYGALADSLMPRSPDDARLHVESLREGALGYFRKTDVDESLWKSIES